MMQLRPLGTPTVRVPFPRRERPLLSRLGATLVVTALLAGGPWASPGNAQDIRNGGVSGIVRSNLGEAISQATLLVTHQASGVVTRATANRSGRYQVDGIPPGMARVRAEAIGYRPKVIEGVPVAPGGRVVLDIQLTVDPPPVERADVEPYASGTGRRFGLGQSRALSEDEFQSLPTIRQDIRSLLDRSSFAGDPEAPGSLPALLSGATLDGFLAMPLTHPSGSGSSLLTSFPSRSSLAFAQVVGAGRDVEHLWVPGVALHALTRRGGPEWRWDAYGAWSGDALWSSDTLEGEVPGLNSFWAGGSLGGPFREGRGSVFVAGEAGRLQTARGALSDVLTSSLGDGDVSSNQVFEFETISGVGRVDLELNRDSRLMLRTNMGVQRASPGSGMRPSLDGAVLPEENASFAVAGHYRQTVRPRLWVEGGVSAGTTRSEYGVDASMPGSWFADSGTGVGPFQQLQGTVTRKDVQVTTTVHGVLGGRRLKGGFSFWTPRYEYGVYPGSTGQVFFPDAQGPSTGEGWATRSLADPGADDFTVVHGSFYGQVEEPLSDDLTLTAGFRLGFEELRQEADSVPLVTDVIGAVGASPSFSSGGKLGGLLALNWRRPSGGALRASVQMDHGRLDPAAISEVLKSGRGVTTEQLSGGLSQWPSVAWSEGTSQPTVSLFGPGIRAPRVFTAQLGGSAPATTGVTLGATAVYRTAEYLLRRRDLNRPLVPAGFDQTGRPFFGDPVRHGTLVTAAPGSNQRFVEFGHVWALDPDGWSEYRGLTAFAELQATESLELFGSYTLSETEDNLIGAASGQAAGQVDPNLSTDSDWATALSDFDARHRAAAGAILEVPVLGGLELTGTYRFRSGYPYTPGFVPGLDANGDGFSWNDVAHAAGAELQLDQEGCDATTVGAFLGRNSCRGPAEHQLDLRFSLSLPGSSGARVRLVLEGFNLLESDVGRIDRALFTTDAAQPITVDGVSGTFNVPYALNPGFGSIVESTTMGRIIRVGARISH